MDNRLCDEKSIKRKKQVLYSIGAGFVFFAGIYIVTGITNSSICPVYNLFGISCFGCGMSRAFLAILSCDYAKALEYNILSIPLFIGIAAYVLLALVDIVFDKNYIYMLERIFMKLPFLFILLIVLFISYYINNF